MIGILVKLTSKLMRGMGVANRDVVDREVVDREVVDGGGVVGGREDVCG